MQKNDDVVVINCMEFPNIIVEGKDENNAMKNFKKAFSYFTSIKNDTLIKQFPLAKNEKIRSLPLTFLTNN